MIPRGVKASIDAYVDDGRPTGDFLRAVLSNDLMEAVARADEYNRIALADICVYIYNFTPNTCHGSADIVNNWIKLHRENPKVVHEMAGGDRDRREKYYETH